MGIIKIIGIGDPAHGDAAAGLIAARKLQEKAMPNVSVLEASDDACDLMDAWEHARTVFFIDAATTGAPPGTIFRCEACEDCDVQHRLYSNGGFGFTEALELARSIALLPPCPILYAVEGAIFDAGEGLTEPVARAVDEVVRRIEMEVIELLSEQEILSRDGL